MKLNPYRFRLCLGLLLMIVVAWASLVAIRRNAPSPRSERRHAMDQILRCRDCHAAQTDFFESVPHAQTLRRANIPTEFMRFTQQTALIGSPPASFRYWERGGRLWCAGDRTNSASPVDWIFGSGHHGQTAVTVRTNDRGEALVLEHHVTWYANHGLNRTIDRPLDLGSGKNDVGELNSPEASRRCFGCHSTDLPENENKAELDLEHLMPGVLCTRCHVNAEHHADGMRAGNPPSGFDNWKALSPFQSVARCGECHRLPTSFPQKELTPQNRTLARFAPVGLLMSRCFQLQHTLPHKDQPPRLDCVTCHDPHLPTVTDPEHYNRSCRGCHSHDFVSQTACLKQPIDSNCIECHMPKVSVDAPTSFTDHWIRVPLPKP